MASRATPAARRRVRACRVRGDSPRAPGRAPRGSGWCARLPRRTDDTSSRQPARGTSSLWWRRRTGAPKREAAGALFCRMPPRRGHRPRTKPTPRPPSRRGGGPTRAEILPTRGISPRRAPRRARESASTVESTPRSVFRKFRRFSRLGAPVSDAASRSTTNPA